MVEVYYASSSTYVGDTRSWQAYEPANPPPPKHSSVVSPFCALKERKGYFPTKHGHGKFNKAASSILP